MNILFLDHDGVICLSKNFGSRFKKMGGKHFSRQDILDLDVSNRFDNFDEKAIKVLNRIIEKTDCEIVVTSDWRNWATLEELGKYYEEQGIIKKPMDFTPFIKDVDVPKDFKWLPHFDFEQERCLEIHDWLKKHDVEKWVDLDDLHLGITVINPSGSGEKDWGLSNFVWCPSVYEGIKQSGIENKVYKFLS